MFSRALKRGFASSAVKEAKNKSVIPRPGVFIFLTAGMVGYALYSVERFMHGGSHESHGETTVASGEKKE